MDVCMPVCMQDWGGSGGMLPQEILEILDALRLLLRPFWNRRLHTSSKNGMTPGCSVAAHCWW